MKEVIRLDKYLCDMGIGTRSEVKNYIKKGRITVNEEVIKVPDLKIDINKDKVTFDQKVIGYVTYEYYMLNKPAGVVSATNDNTAQTVIDLIGSSARKDLFPVGRLDKDTEGLLLITNDGVLAHQLLSPKKHVGKVYYAKIQGLATKEDVKTFREGIVISDEFTALPAELVILNSGEISEIEITIFEGKFHQVKRMFEAVGKEVIYLKRLSMGTLKIDNNLAVGEYRELTEDELYRLTQVNRMEET